jgi:diguanylate cyclase (GGDEF)-like protein
VFAAAKPRSCFRVGGDEFAVILHEASAADARATANWIAQTLHDTSETSKLTTSFGIAICDDACEGGALLRTADDAMYGVKRYRRALKMRVDEGDDLRAIV